MDLAAIQAMITQNHGWVLQVRRRLHQHPELGDEEFWTSDTIAEYLDALGIPYQRDVANTGIVGLIEGGRPGKTVALRADMDALPIQEATGLAYASQIEGRMHACGHDAHMAILLGTAKLLQEMRDQIKGRVKLLFQPAEETDGGAERMIKEGCMENPHVDYVLGLHMAEDIQTGQIMIRRGALTASSDLFTITVKGKSAHAAYPHESIDAVVLAAHVVTTLQTIVSRTVAPLDSSALTIGTIHGGTKENIIADQVILTGTVRTLDLATRKTIKEKIAAIAPGVCRSLGGDCTVVFKEGYMPIINHDQVVDVIEMNGRQLLGEGNVIYKEKPSMGVEDFSFFCQHTPGAFYYLGCGNPSLGIGAPAHGPYFQIDESCLKTGVLMQVINTLTLLESI